VISLPPLQIDRMTFLYRQGMQWVAAHKSPEYTDLSRDTIIIQLLEQGKRDTLREIAVKLIDVIDGVHKITALSNTDRLQLKAPLEQIKELVETPPL
jgi:hypothetical protein